MEFEDRNIVHHHDNDMDFKVLKCLLLINIKTDFDWKKKRTVIPNELLSQERFVDFWITCCSKSYPCHRIILASHSDYFLRCLQSGMKEQNEGVMELTNIDPEVFDVVHSYIYSGNLKRSCSNLELLSDVFMAANMFQMEDLEVEVVLNFFQCLTPENCLEIRIILDKLFYFYPNKKYEGSVNDCLDNFINECAQNRWKDLILTPGFVALNIDQLSQLLEVKSHQEELSDFSHSFIQNDLILGISIWLEYDLKHRFHHIRPNLSHFYCLHQARQQAKRIVPIYKKICEELAKGHFKLPLEIGGADAEWYQFKSIIEFPELFTELCNGQFCPFRMHNGLLVVTASSETVGIDLNPQSHVKYYFYALPLENQIQSSISYTTTHHHQQLFHSNRMYRLRDLEMFSEDYIHPILPNNHLAWREKSDILPLNFLHCATFCRFNHFTISKGSPQNKNSTNFISTCPIITCATKKARLEQKLECDNLINLNPTKFNSRNEGDHPELASIKCERSNLTGLSSCYVEKFPIRGRTTDEASQDVILVIGGYFYELGEEVDVVICSQVVSEDEYGDEETFKSSPPSENFAVTNQYQYQSLNHTMISTEVVRCSYQPYPQTNMLLYSHVNNAWTHLADLVGDDIKVPFSLCDHSVIRVDNQIMVIGGLTLKNDPPRELYYFEPQKSLWIFDLESRDWRQGPDLPLMPKGEEEEELIGYARGTSYLINNDDAQQIIYSGGIQLKINKEINQIYEYVTNTKVFLLDLQKENLEWMNVLDLSDVEQVLPDFNVYAILPTKIRLPKFRIRDKKLDYLVLTN